MEKAMGELQTNSYYTKYADKIAKLQKTSPEEFLARAEHLVKKGEDATGKTPVSKPVGQPKSPMSQSSYAFAPQKKLDAIMKTEMLKDRSTDEIGFIWNKYFSEKSGISGVIQTKQYEKISERAAQYPTFIFPLPKDQGYEFIVAQFAANEIHFTSLINYQTHHENAPENLTIIHYTELSAEKGIVLMHGEINKDAITAQEAQFLANQVQLYYGGDDDEKLGLMEKFTREPESFKHMDLIAQIENIDLGSLNKTK